MDLEELLARYARPAFAALRERLPAEGSADIRLRIALEPAPEEGALAA